MTDEDLFAMVKHVDPRAVRLPPGLRVIAAAIEATILDRVQQESEPVAYVEGNSYLTLAGDTVKILKQLGAENGYAMECSDGKYRYNRPGDRGRCTGTPHDYSCEHNLVRHYAHPPAPQATIPEWQPIATAPKDGRQLLLHGDGQGIIACTYVGEWNRLDEYWLLFGTLHCQLRPTHWMPLPAAPTPEEGEG